MHKNRRWWSILFTVCFGLLLALLGPRYAPNVLGGQTTFILFMTFGYVCFDLFMIWREQRNSKSE